MQHSRRLSSLAGTPFHLAHSALALAVLTAALGSGCTPGTGSSAGTGAPASQGTATPTVGTAAPVSAPVSAEPRRLEKLADAELAPTRAELLDRAFAAASRIPDPAHTRDRCRLQEEVVDACLRLDLPVRAAGCARGIDNWRKGVAFAEIGLWCARRGLEGEARGFIEVARSSAKGDQGWQDDRVRVGIGRVYAALGEERLADSLEAGVVEAERGRVAEIRVDALEADDLDARLAALGAVVAEYSFDLSRNALAEYTALLRRFGADPATRERILADMRLAWKDMPVIAQLDAMGSLADTAVAIGALDTARILCDEADALIDGSAWLPEDKPGTLARFAELRHRSGDTRRARERLEAALACYDETEDAIVDIWRAGALRPIAHAFFTMGEHGSSHDLYNRAVEVGSLNPNSRPRAEDLCRTCLSIADCGLEVRPELLARVREIAAGLSDPW
ncbi:MAG: hypothetical protein RIS86_2256 [Planctomycetota bacterium]